MRKQQALRPQAKAANTPDNTPETGGYWTGSGAVLTPSTGSISHRLRFHLVWVPKHENAKYHRRVLSEPVAARLGELLRQACEVNRWARTSGT